MIALDARGGALATLDTPTVPQVQLRVKLHEDLLQLTRVVQSEVGIDTDILWNAMFKVSLDRLILLVLLSRQLTAELHDQLRKLLILEQLRCHSFDQVFAHPLDVLPVDDCAIEANAAPIDDDQECLKLPKGFIYHFDKSCLYLTLFIFCLRDCLTRVVIILFFTDTILRGLDANIVALTLGFKLCGRCAGNGLSIAAKSRALVVIWICYHTSLPARSDHIIRVHDFTGLLLQ